jgi:hypothetical protein
LAVKAFEEKEKFDQGMNKAYFQTNLDKNIV